MKFFRQSILPLLFLTSFLSRTSVAQERDSSVKTLNVVAASLLPAFTFAGAIYENYADFWRNAERVPFYFSNDPPYSMHNDKFGHAFFTSMTGDVIEEGYKLAGVDDRTAAWLGGSSAFLTEFIVEIEDGFRGGSPAFGFSPGDFAADVIGGSFPIIRYYAPITRRFTYKASLWPSEPLKAGAYSSILSDDESHFYWMSYDIHNDLSAIHWPAWLNVVVGYGAEHLDNVSAPPGWSNGQRSSQVYLGLDLNLKGLPIEGKAWEVIAELLSHYKIPFPALQVMPRVKGWWFR